MKSRINLSTLFGIAGAGVVLWYGVLAGTVRKDIFVDPHALILVLGGTLAAALIAFPMSTFRDLWGFARWGLPAALPPEPAVTVRRLRVADWPALLALDLAGFGAPRDAVLRDFAARLPGAALAVEAPEGGLRGVLLGRDGVRGPQLGPLHAKDEAAARALLATGLAAAPGAVVDLREAALPGLAGWLATHGAAPQRPFTRMVLGEAGLPGDPAGLVAVAGPEFG